MWMELSPERNYLQWDGMAVRGWNGRSREVNPSSEVEAPSSQAAPGYRRSSSDARPYWPLIGQIRSCDCITGL